MSLIRPHQLLLAIAATAVFALSGAAIATATCGEGEEEFGSIHVTPQTWKFDGVGKSKVFTVKNAGTSTINDLKVFIAPNEDYFELSGTTCTGTLAASATCEVTIKSLKLGGSDLFKAASLEKTAIGSAELES